MATNFVTGLSDFLDQAGNIARKSANEKECCFDIYLIKDFERSVGVPLDFAIFLGLINILIRYVEALYV